MINIEKLMRNSEEDMTRKPKPEKMNKTVNIKALQFFITFFSSKQPNSSVDLQWPRRYKKISKKSTVFSSIIILTTFILSE